MKRGHYIISLLCILLVLTGCTTLKRYRSATYQAVDNSLVGMDLFGYQLTPSGTAPEGRNLWELSASAQTQLIQILDDRYPDNAQFIQALNQEYLSDPAGPVYDYTKKNLRMVFTISKRRDYASLSGGYPSGHFSPADRIEYLQFSLSIPEETHLRFTEWNRFTTEYGEIEIGDISFTRSLDLEAEGVLPEEVDLGSSGFFGRTERQKVRSRYLILNGSIGEHRIEIGEEGTREIDLTGNVIVDVSVEFSPFPERITVPIFNTAGHSPVDTGAVAALRFMDVVVPRMEEAPDTICAVLEMNYVYRHVRSGWKTYQEWDDRVEYYTGSVSKKIPLFYKEDYLPSFYCIAAGEDEKEALRVRAVPEMIYPLQFRSYPEATSFFNWLHTQAAPELEEEEPIAIGSHVLIHDGVPLTRNSLNRLNDLKVMPVFGH